LNLFLIDASQIDFNYSPLCCEIQLLKEKYPTWCDFLQIISGRFEEIHIPTCVKRDQIYMYILNINDVDVLTDLLNAIQTYTAYVASTI